MHSFNKVYYIVLLRLLGGRALFLKKYKKTLVLFKGNFIFALPKRKWRHSSAGSEHLPYKQRVTGSNPVASTPKGFNNFIEAFFVLCILCCHKNNLHIHKRLLLFI